MISIEIGAGSVANIVSTLESIGFQADSQDGQKLYWPYDTDNNIYVYVYTNNSNTRVVLRNSSGTDITGSTLVQYATASSWRIVYEIIGENVVFGFLLASTAYNKIQFAIIAPKSQNDTWLYTGINNTAQAVYLGNTETSITFGEKPLLYTGSANGIQIVKFYNGARFVDNLYITTVCTGIGTSTTAGNNNYIEATIDEKVYLIIKFVSGTGANQTNAINFAIEKTTSNS